MSMYEAEAIWSALPADERKRHFAAYATVRQNAESQGHLLAADGLAASDQAKTVRQLDDRLTVTDGRFAETKEQL